MPIFTPVDLLNNVIGANVDLSLLTLAAAGVGMVASPDQINGSQRGLKLAINTTAITGTAPTLTVVIQGKDVLSGVYYTIATSAIIAATGTVVIDVYPGIAAVANLAIGLPLPRTWRVTATVAGTTPAVTATIGASLLD
jgi:hypothetical protein